MKLKTNFALACAIALASPMALAQTISASNTNATINTAFPPGHTASVTIDRQGATVRGFLFELTYNTAHLSLGTPHTDPGTPHPRVTTVGTGAADLACVENTVGTLRCVASTSVTSATFVLNVAFDVLGTAAVSPLTFVPANTNYNDVNFADVPYATVTDGSVTIAAAPPANPPVLTFAPAGGTVVQGTNITITPSGGQAGGSANYNCTLPPGVTLANNAGTINTGGAVVTLTPTCSAGNPDGAMSCTHTGFTGSTPSPVNYTIDCPAAPAPAFTVVGSAALTCNGTAGAVVPVNATFTNSGNATMNGATCALSNQVGTFVVATQPAAAINAGAQGTATVNCTVPATGSSTATLTCTAAGATNNAVFTLSSTAPPPVPLPTVIPTNSLWSKLGLVGLLAVLGLVAVGFRRQH